MLENVLIEFFKEKEKYFIIPVLSFLQNLKKNYRTKI